jgi:hypothetical protein
MAFAAAALAGCGSSGSSNNASVRLVNATLTHASIICWPIRTHRQRHAVDTRERLRRRRRRQPVAAGQRRHHRRRLAVTAPTVREGAKFALVAYESGGAVRTAVISEGTTAPPASTAIVRVFNAATDAGSIDVYITDPAVDITTLSSPTFTFTASTSVQASNFLSFGPAAPTGSASPARATPADLRLDIPSSVLAASGSRP